MTKKLDSNLKRPLIPRLFRTHSLQLALPFRNCISIGIAGLLAGLTAGIPTIARACICDTSPIPHILPQDHSTDVPINTRVWIPGGEFNPHPRNAVLRHGDEEVPITFSRIDFANKDSSSVHVMHPNLLEIHTKYEIYVDGILRSTFHTGNSPDREAPQLPQVFGHSAINLQIDDLNFDCGDRTYGALFQLGYDGIAVIADANPVLTMDEVFFSGTVGELSTTGNLFFGKSTCNAGWPNDVGDQEGDQATVRFGVIDIAGNFSGWSPENEVILPAVEFDDFETPLDEATDEDNQDSDDLKPDPGFQENESQTCNLVQGDKSNPIVVILFSIFACHRRSICRSRITPA